MGRHAFCVINLILSCLLGSSFSIKWWVGWLAKAGGGGPSHIPDFLPSCWPLSLAPSLHWHFLGLVVIVVVIVAILLITILLLGGICLAVFWHCVLSL